MTWPATPSDLRAWLAVLLISCIVLLWARAARYRRQVEQMEKELRAWKATAQVAIDRGWALDASNYRLTEVAANAEMRCRSLDAENTRLRGIMVTNTLKEPVV
jgi:hypothetical protein